MGRWISRDPKEEEGGINLYVFVKNDPVNFSDPNGLDVYVYNYGFEGRGYGHVGLIVPTDHGTYVRFSQGADDPKAPCCELTMPMHRANVDIKVMSSPCMPGAKMVKVPTKHNDQIWEAIEDYIRGDWPYNIGTNNCADFVNDVLNAVDDINLSDKTIPNSYFNQIVKKYGLYKCKH